MLPSSSILKTSDNVLLIRGKLDRDDHRVDGIAATTASCHIGSGGPHFALVKLDRSVMHLLSWMDAIAEVGHI